MGFMKGWRKMNIKSLASVLLFSSGHDSERRVEMLGGFLGEQSRAIK